MLVGADAWGLDFLLTGSQKALALPPGLAFGKRQRTDARARATLPGRGQYFDLLEYDRYWQKHQTPTTPAVSLIYALVEQLRRIEAEGGSRPAPRALGDGGALLAGWRRSAAPASGSGSWPRRAAARPP
jgi:aspartate aminotransferase-like enzyme